MILSEYGKIEFEDPKKTVEIISTKTKLKTRKISINDGKTFFEQFKCIDNTGKELPYIKHIRISSKLNLKEKAIYHRHKMPLHDINHKPSCECGSMVDIRDEIRGEIVCPTCGIVHDQIYTIHIEKTRMEDKLGSEYNYIHN